VFDGQCGLCRKSVAVADRYDSTGLLEFIPYQSEIFERRFPRIHRRLAEATVIVITHDGEMFTGARAVSEIARLLGGVFAVMGFILMQPVLSHIAERTYRLIARNRSAVSKRMSPIKCETGS
jgi:predicted DCC family thiol-disulfide oxidoreductase YuxK